MMKKLCLLLAALLVLTLACAVSACAQELTFGSFTLTLPEDAVPDAEDTVDDDPWYVTKDTYLSFTYRLYEESTIEEIIDFDYDYAAQVNPEYETELVRATPYVVFMMSDDEGFIIVYVNYGAEDLSIYAFPDYYATPADARRTVAALLDTIVFDGPDGVVVGTDTGWNRNASAWDIGDISDAGDDLTGALLDLAGQGLSLLTDFKAQ